MPNLIRDQLIESRSVYFDSARWDGYQPREDDIVIATYPKCGTTWTQRIVGMLVYQSDESFGVQESSPWPDMRMPPPGAMLELAESQTHRRYFKTHLPYDALPVYEGMKFIHVARDGRDAAMSFHNHKMNYTENLIERANEIIAEDPKFDGGFQLPDPDEAVHFHDWILGPEDHIGDITCGFWYMENSYWAAKDDPNMLLVHYNDMKKDLDGEMRRIAEFLEIETPPDLWPKLVKAATFDDMKSKADELMPTAGEIWEGGGNTFLHKGTNKRWEGVVDQADLDRYDELVKEKFSPELAHWIEFGQLG